MDVFRTPEEVTGMAGQQTCQFCKGGKGPSYMKNVKIL